MARGEGFDLEVYRAKHRDYRGRMEDGRRNYLELCPETGATVLVVEGPEITYGTRQRALKGRATQPSRRPQ